MLGNANRLKILVFLDGHGRSVGDMEAALSIHQPTLSQQLAELRNAGLIVGRKAAKSVIYTLTDDTGRPALEAIYLASGHAVTPAPPRSHSSTQAAVFASVLCTRGSPAPLWYPGMKSVIEE
jgi:DNA-binding transcriptional ArsR family regulator